jgi:hypothetical protein
MPSASLCRASAFQAHVIYIIGPTKRIRKGGVILSEFNRTGNVHTNVILRHGRVTIITVENNKSVSVVLIIRHEKRMRHITLSSVACRALPYFNAQSHKRYHIRKKLLNIKYVLIFLYKLCLKRFSF